MEDDHVDRPGVEAQQCVQLTGTNSSIGLIALINQCPSIMDNRHEHRHSFASFRPLPAWWPLRSDKTRSHPELGRQTLQRQWYYVSRPGRVGRRQACEAHEIFLFDVVERGE